MAQSWRPTSPCGATKGWCMQTSVTPPVYVPFGVAGQWLHAWASPASLSPKPEINKEPKMAGRT
eukprot:137674-Prorocentrum_lima.AAC.1